MPSCNCLERSQQPGLSTAALCQPVRLVDSELWTSFILNRWCLAVTRGQFALFVKPFVAAVDPSDLVCQAFDAVDLQKQGFITRQTFDALVASVRASAIAAAAAAFFLFRFFFKKKVSLAC